MQYQKPVISKILNICHIMRYNTLDACKQLTPVLISFRLDYGNALLYDLPSTLMTPLQKVQNSSARLVTRTHKIEHISLVLDSLHWHQVIYRSLYNIVIYTRNLSFRISQQCPNYLSLEYSEPYQQQGE
jgi:hypothetical protein